MKVFLTACVGLDHDIVLLDAFCQHYLSLGIPKEHFLLVLNTSEVGHINSKINKGLSILDKYGIEALDVWCTIYESNEKWSRVHNLLNKFVQADDWVVHPDADEFHDIPVSTYQELFSAFDSQGINAFQGILVDRLRNDCTILKQPNNVICNPFNEFPKHANLSSLLKSAGVKLMGYRGNMRANNGSGQIHQQCRGAVAYAHGSPVSLHETSSIINILGDPDYNNRPIALEDWDTKIAKIRNDAKFLVHHFKWHGNAIEKLEQRIQIYTSLKRPQVGQSIRALEHYRKNGKFILDSGTP